MLIGKEAFCDIINKLIKVNDFVNETNAKARTLDNAIESDFFNASTLSISHEHIVVELLQNIFNDKDDIIGWWLYELDYGRNKENAWIEENGVKMYLYTAADLYKYLIKESK